MRRNIWTRRTGWLAGLALGLWSLGTAGAMQPPAGVELPPGAQVAMPGAPVPMSEHWIGVECYPAPEALRAQLNLPKDQGLVVASVVPDSPAAKAGIQEHDVLKTVGGKALGQVQDLIQAVEAAKEKPLKLELVRGGKPLQLEVQPAKRPEQPPPGAAAPGSDWETQMRRWLERRVPGWEGRQPLRFRFFSPGVILPPDAAAEQAMPENMSVVITRQGKEPAKIVVKRGDEKWEVTENELDKLPAEIRAQVEPMLGRGMRRSDGRLQFFDFVPDWSPWSAAPAVPEAQAEPEAAAPPKAPEGRMEKRLESLEHRLEQMRKSLDDLRENRPRLRERPEKPKAADASQEKI